MAFNVTARNEMLNTLRGLIGYVSLHTGDPGTTGASELSAGVEYSREAIVFLSASAARLELNGSVVVDVPSSTTISYAGFWSASTGGVYQGSQVLPSSEVYTGAGTYTVTGLTITQNST